jgi:tetratricopeptide (TPR) repeat protein
MAARLPAGLALATLLVAACAPDDPHPPRAASSVRNAVAASPLLSADELRALTHRRFEVDASDRDHAVVQQLVESRERFFDALPSDAILNEMELVFVATGRLHDLADLYREAIDRDPAHTSLRSRLAWLYQRLDRTTHAHEQTTLCLEERPDDARCHFVSAFLVAQLPDTPERLAQVRDSFQRVLQLDPAFIGPGGVSATEIREQIRLLDARIERIQGHDHDHDHDDHDGRSAR